MKEMIIALMLALFLSCVFNGFFLESPPYPYAVGLGDVKESSFGLKREEGNIPEVNYTDGSRAPMYMTTIDEHGDEKNVEFPLGAAN